MTPLGVLLVPGPAERRGAPAFAWHVARNLRALGHRAALVTAPGPLLPDMAASGVPCFVRPFTWQAVLDAWLTRALARHLRAEAYDLVHAIGAEWAPAAARLARALGLPFLVTVSAPPAGRARLPVHRPDCRAVLAASQEIREDLVNVHRVPRDLIRVVEPGVDLRWFAPPPPAPAGPRALPVAGLVAHLDAASGAEVLIEAVRALATDGEGWHVLIAGEGPALRSVHRLAWRQGVADRVTVVPPTTDYRFLLHTMDVCVSPGARAGMRLFVLEAMAAARPVIAAAAGSAFTMVREGETGFVVRPGDPVALADALRTLAADPARGPAMGAAGRRWVAERWNLAERVTELVDVYRRALGA